MLTAVGAAAPAPASALSDRREAGHARFFKGADGTLDGYVARRDCRRIFAAYTRLRLFSPSADRCVRGGFRRALAYVNAQAIAVADVRARRSDDGATRAAKRRLDRLVLRDGQGWRLYVPFGCSRGRCPQYAADVSSPAWRRYLARSVREITRTPYAGVFLDDVNFDRNVGDGRGQPATPIRRGSAGELTAPQWKAAMAALVRTVRRAAPRRELMVNTVWWKPESSLDDPVVASGVAAATDFEIERGTDDTRRGQSFDGLMTVIDRLHGMGLGVTLENYDAVDRSRAEFELATHLLTTAGRDTFAAEWRSCPRPTRRYRPCRQSFWPRYKTNLGPALGPREQRPDGMWQRRFQRGLVVVNPPGSPPREGPLGGLYRDLDNTPRVFAALAGDQALVLRR